MAVLLVMRMVIPLERKTTSNNVEQTAGQLQLNGLGWRPRAKSDTPATGRVACQVASVAPSRRMSRAAVSEKQRCPGSNRRLAAPGQRGGTRRDLEEGLMFQPHTVQDVRVPELQRERGHGPSGTHMEARHGASLRQMHEAQQRSPGPSRHRDSGKARRAADQSIASAPLCLSVCHDTDSPAPPASGPHVLCPVRTPVRTIHLREVMTLTIERRSLITCQSCGDQHLQLMPEYSYPSTARGSGAR